MALTKQRTMFLGAMLLMMAKGEQEATPIDCHAH